MKQAMSQMALLVSISLLLHTAQTLPPSVSAATPFDSSQTPLIVRIPLSLTTCTKLLASTTRALTGAHPPLTLRALEPQVDHRTVLLRDGLKQRVAPVN